MRKEDDVSVFIENRSYKTVSVYCDICGDGTRILYRDVLLGNRGYDFCPAHRPDVIPTYIELNLPPYNSKSYLKDKQILNEFEYRISKTITNTQGRPVTFRRWQIFDVEGNLHFSIQVYNTSNPSQNRNIPFESESKMNNCYKRLVDGLDVFDELEIISK